MSELLDRVFPTNQCLSDEAIALAESSMESDIVLYFMVYGPDVYDPKSGQVHLQSPFTTTSEEIREQSIVYEGLHQYAPELTLLRKKLL